MSRQIMEQALNALKDTHWSQKNVEAIATLEAELAKPTNEFHPDWDTLKPYHDRIAELEAQLVKTEYSDLRAAAEMALEYLEYLNELEIAGLDHEVHTNALRQALAQPEQEPIQAINDVIDYLYSTGADNDMANRAHIALKQLQMNLRDQTALHLLYKGDYEDLIAQPEQEPVAWWNPITNNASTDPYYRKSKECIPLYTAPQKPDVTLTDEGKTEQGCAECGKKESDGWALYCVDCLLPAKREWVGLTDAEREAIILESYRKYNDGDPDFVARAIEAKLREKNEF